MHTKVTKSIPPMQQVLSFNEFKPLKCLSWLSLTSGEPKRNLEYILHKGTTIVQSRGDGKLKTWQAILLLLKENLSARMAGQPLWKTSDREITTECTETMSNRRYSSSIYNLFSPLKNLTTTIARINNDVFIATTQEIIVSGINTPKKYSVSVFKIQVESLKHTKKIKNLIKFMRFIFNSPINKI